MANDDRLAELLRWKADENSRAEKRKADGAGLQSQLLGRAQDRLSFALYDHHHDPKAQPAAKEALFQGYERAYEGPASRMLDKMEREDRAARPIDQETHRMNNNDRDR